MENPLTQNMQTCISEAWDRIDSLPFNTCLQFDATFLPTKSRIFQVIVIQVHQLCEAYQHVSNFYYVLRIQSGPSGNVAQ